MRRLAACGFLALLLTALPVAAEVAAVSQDDLTVVYEVRSIVDDSEPVGSSWVRIYPDGPHKVVLNDGGADNGDGEPSLYLDSAGGIAAAAWSRNSPSGYDVVLSIFEVGFWSSPLVLAGSPSDDLDPQLVADLPGSAVHLVYWTKSTTPQVVRRESSVDLSTWGPAIPLSVPGETAVRPGACMHEGLLRVAYEVHPGGYGTAPRQIVLATIGETVTTQVIATTLHNGPNRPQVHSDGSRMWIDWIDSDDEMAWTAQDGAGGWTPVQLQTYRSIEERDFGIRGAIRSLVIN